MISRDVSVTFEWGFPASSCIHSSVCVRTAWPVLRCLQWVLTLNIEYTQQTIANSVFLCPLNSSGFWSKAVKNKSLNRECPTLPEISGLGQRQVITKGERADADMAPATSPCALGWKGVIRDLSMRLTKACHHEEKSRLGKNVSPHISLPEKRKKKSRCWREGRSHRVRMPLWA